ncbi:MAG: type II secretion system protein [Georgfuchsia sp.]
MNKPHAISRHSAGFTLVEAIMVIAITGILSAVVAVFIKGPVEGYFDSARRADLTDAADTTLKRIARDVQTALPNSLRADVGGACVEFLPVVGGGRYRNAQSSALSGNVFDFTTISAFSFDVLADNRLGSLPAGTNHVVVYNLGFSGADAYNGDNRRSISSVSGTSPNMTVALNAGVQFPFESPGKRFQVIADNAVVYSCSGSNLLRATRSITTPMAACPVAGTTMVSNVDCANSSFKYTPAVSPRNGLLTLVLTLTQSGESVRLYHEVHVENVP